MNEYQRALDEYKEICAYHRAEDQLKWQILGIGYGGAGILVVAAVSTRFSVASLVLAGFAAAIAVLGTAVYDRLSKYTLWRLERAWELEETVLGFDHHLHLRTRGRETKNRINLIVRLGYWLPCLMWVALLVVTVTRLAGA